MTSQAMTLRWTTHAQLGALASGCRALADELQAAGDNLERCSRRVTTLTAIGLMALCAAIVLVAVCFSRWGMLSPVVATVDSMALIVGVLWLRKIDRRSRLDIAKASRAAQRMRGDAVVLSDTLDELAANETPENVLSQAIATVDSIALTAGGIWLDKIDKRSRGDIATPRRTAKPAVIAVSGASSR
jgi:general stress protein CsbA